MRLSRALFAVTIFLLASAGLVRAQAIVAHDAGGPARLDGPWLLYEGDPPGGESASADPRPGQVTSSALSALQFMPLK